MIIQQQLDCCRPEHQLGLPTSSAKKHNQLSALVIESHKPSREMFLFSGYNFQLYIYIPRPTLSSQLVLSAHSGLHGGNIPRSSHGKTGEGLLGGGKFGSRFICETLSRYRPKTAKWLFWLTHFLTVFIE